MVPVLAAVVALLASALGADALNYTLCHEWKGNDFSKQFYWWDNPDPTHGQVKYVDQKTAAAEKLAYVDPATGRFIMRVDSQGPVVPISKSIQSPGRKSVRIHSKELFEDMLLIAKVTMMPEGCGTWPALWSTGRGDSWPHCGELDLIEGVNGRGNNQVSMHTGNGCSLPKNINNTQTGSSRQMNCAYQPGCSTTLDSNVSFGSAFNQNRVGKEYAAPCRVPSLTKQIQSWFWPGNTPPETLPPMVGAPPGAEIPSSLVNSPETLATWGVPAANFGAASATCPMDKMFGQHEIIIDTTLCGEWGDYAFNSSKSCPSSISCSAFVAQNASAFENARWEVDYLRIYATRCKAAAPPGAQPRLWFAVVVAMGGIWLLL